MDFELVLSIYAHFMNLICRNRVLHHGIPCMRHIIRLIIPKIKMCFSQILFQLFQLILLLYIHFSLFIIKSD
jgi:hypothetical protein